MLMLCSLHYIRGGYAQSFRDAFPIYPNPNTLKLQGPALRVDAHPYTQAFVPFPLFPFPCACLSCNDIWFGDSEAIASDRLIPPF